MHGEKNENNQINLNSDSNNSIEHSPLQEQAPLNRSRRTNEHSNNVAEQKDELVNEKKESFIKEIFKFVLITLIVVVPIRLFIAQPFVVNGASMDPTFASGEYLIVDEISYRFNEPERGDVIVFSFPRDPKKFFIKRIIGLPSDIVTIDGRSVTITDLDNPNGVLLEEPYISENDSRKDHMSITLGSSEYFVMGDNRSASFDSRDWGPVNKKLIIGRALARLLPVNTIELFPGYINYAQEYSVTDTNE